MLEQIVRKQIARERALESVRREVQEPLFSPRERRERGESARSCRRETSSFAEPRESLELVSRRKRTGQRAAHV